jgi:hypothetical protein
MMYKAPSAALLAIAGCSVASIAAAAAPCGPGGPRFHINDADSPGGAHDVNAIFSFGGYGHHMNQRAGGCAFRARCQLHRHGQLHPRCCQLHPRCSGAAGFPRPLA